MGALKKRTEREGTLGAKTGAIWEIQICSSAFLPEFELTIFLSFFKNCGDGFKVLVKKEDFIGT